MKDYYGIEGSSDQWYCASRHAPEGAVLMPEARPGEHFICEAGVWVIDPVAVWEADMAATDIDMPRWAEDIWDVLGINNAPTYVQEVYNTKKEIRNRKPDKVK